MSEKMFIIPESLVIGLLNYLVNQRYADVADGIDRLKKLPTYEQYVSQVINAQVPIKLAESD